VHTEVNETGRFERTLTIQLEESELEDAKSKAARKLSKTMKIKGFRPGKAPRSIVERMVGKEELRSDAIEEVIPDAVNAAIDESGLDPATVPSVTDIRDLDDGGVEVDVLVTLWPALEAIPDFEGTTVEIDPPVATDEEIQQQIDGLRNQFADLEDVDRPARKETSSRSTSPPSPTASRSSRRPPTTCSTRSGPARSSPDSMRSSSAPASEMPSKAKERSPEDSWTTPKRPSPSGPSSKRSKPSSCPR
jgi:hypothetical protein